MEVVMSSSGDIVVVWTSDGTNGSDGSSTSIQGQRFSRTGVPVGPEFQVNGYTDDSQYNAAVAMRDDGTFVVV